MRTWWYRRYLVILVLVLSVLGSGLGMEQIQAEAERQEVSTKSIDSDMVIPGGMPIGIYMEMDGVFVLDTESIECVDGTLREPAKNLVKTGDYIVEINGKAVETKKELVQEVNKLNSEDVILTIRREDEKIDIKMKCAKVANNKYKLGIWVKDNVQGLGTVTYLTMNSEFGALGHGIHDAESEKLLEIEEGSVYTTNIVGVEKGKKGEPGGLEGIIIYNRYNEIGTIETNTENGIYGRIEKVDSLFEKQEPMKICKKEDVELGRATILCTIDDKVEEYDIKIKNIDSYAKAANKELIIEVVDEELIEATGGIVQGFSGAPILQDGKIVGAVTHVLVNDPTRGYGIFIEDMLKNADGD